MSNIAQAFNKLKDDIAKKINDAASLEVVTFTGTYTMKTNQAVSGDNTFDIDQVLQKLKSDINSDLNLVAYSTIKLDGDQINIVKENLNSEQMELVKFHREMIEASQNSRKAIFDMIKGLAT